MPCTCGNPSTKSISVCCSIVKIKTAHCTECGKTIREYEIIGHPERPDLVDAIERLHKLNLRTISESRKLAIDFLERTLDQMTALSLGLSKSLAKKRLDLWERRYLKSQLGDDYYS